MEKIEHRMNNETATRRQRQTGILTIVARVICVEDEMIQIEESRRGKTPGDQRRPKNTHRTQ